MNTEILSTPFIERCVALLKNCSATESIGAIIGGNGTGKSCAMRALELRYGKLGLPGTCFRYRCCQIEAGATRGIRDLLLELGAGGAALMNGSSVSVHVLSRIAIREFKQHNIRTLLLDEADQWSVQTLGGLVSLYDLCKEKEHPITLIVAGAERHERWIGALPAMRSRTLHFENSTNLDEAGMASVLKSWGEPFSGLVARVEAGENPAKRVFTRIFKGTSGNFRRLFYFTELAKQHPGQKIDTALVDAVLAKMVNS
jgi:hypothetical protein